MKLQVPTWDLNYKVPHKIPHCHNADLLTGHLGQSLEQEALAEEVNTLKYVGRDKA